MGAGPSLGKFLKSMDDDELAKLVENVYKLEPQRMEKMFAQAKQRYYEETGEQQPRDADVIDAAAALSLSASLLQHSLHSSSAPPPLSEMLPPPSTTVASSARETKTAPNTEEIVNPSPVAGDKDQMNALWTFEGHVLRKMQEADKNPQNGGMMELLSKNGGGADSSTGAGTLRQRELDADGYPVMYGSCGRDKRYNRCTVCYYRGLRCNTDHYCACCQKAVCIRPRIYPGEEHPKICWNVLHMDKELVKRVQKKKKRKASSSASASGRVTRQKSVESFIVLRPTSQNAVVPDVSGAVAL
ncbi:hypothetical protein F442_17457 [Phytophthora nicotianae P10297]|uniref:Uncharacterized protein n=6 Tax=Phytophthora nicotianae TaxID=4792 RepID=W2QZ79_PHYN3|nr:hypothetical protein PPTG_04033 [Phytophthora nicotianae INRA-310]ETL83125.1 hypothetical protein L917_16859 [Phytophthora nicotianae]ETN18413.1 hypothetical protein PPTG_04033 [Phytophthora nicotianae INRA-310]ETP34196.1 hypothetical protein F442_17457 [Phytophthora nicotianae P10297]